MKVTKEQVEQLIRESVQEISSPTVNVDAANAFDQQNKESSQPIEYAVKVNLNQSHEGYQLKAEALIWDEIEIDDSEVNHIKMELERMVTQFIKDKNRNARKIR